MILYLIARLSARSDRGATTVEYAMLIALAVIIFAGAWGFTHVLHGLFQQQCNQIAAPGTC